MSAGVAITESSVAGRFFFMKMGVSVTSSAPASSKSFHGVAEHLRARIVDVRFEDVDGGGLRSAGPFADEDAKNVRLRWKILIARAEALRKYADRRQAAITLGERGEQGRARGRGEFCFWAGRVDRRLLQEFGSGGSGHRENAVFGR